MARRIREHMRRNVVGYVALFFTMSMGTAYATHPGGADTISSGDIINDNVNSADVRDDTLTNGGLQAVDLRADSVGSSEVAADAIGSDEVATDAIGSDEVAADSLAAADLAPDSVGNSELGDNSVTGPNVFPSSLSGADIGTGTLTSSDIAAGAVGSSEVADESLGTAEFASSIPAARATRTVGQNIPDNSVTTLNFNSERYDTAGMHSNTTNLSRLTAPVSGIYAVTAQIRWEATGSGYRCLDLRRSGAEVVAAQCWDAPIIVDPDMNVSTMLRLAAGDFVEARATQSCCDTLTILKGNAFTPEFSMTWLAPGP